VALATSSVWLMAKMAFTCDFTVPPFEIEECHAAHTAFLFKPTHIEFGTPSNAEFR